MIGRLFTLEIKRTSHLGKYPVLSLEIEHEEFVIIKPLCNENPTFFVGMPYTMLFLYTTNGYIGPLTTVNTPAWTFK